MINDERLPRDLVVMGASAGGLEALTGLLARLPADLPAAVAVALHRSPFFASRLAQLLGRRAALPVLEPDDGTPIEHGRVYLAPRDRHMLVEPERLRLSHGPRQHHTRPAIDPLLVSAARSYGRRVVGVLLSGGGDDGVIGLVAVNVVRGITLVQDPDEARVGHMPRVAIARDYVNAALSLSGIATALTTLAAGGAVRVDGDGTDGRAA